MIRPSGTDPRRLHSFSTTPTCWFGMWRVVSHRASRGRTNRATRPARYSGPNGPRADAVPPTANTTGNMGDPEVGGWALRPEMNDGCALSSGPAYAPGRPARLADGLGLESAPVTAEVTCAPGAVSRRPRWVPRSRTMRRETRLH